MAIKQRPDSPTNNFATLNPLFRNSTLISNGNLKFNKSTEGWVTSLANLNLNDGRKYYFEGMATLVGGSNSGIFIGLSKQSATQDNFGQSGIWSFGGTGSVLKIYDETTLVTPSGSSAANDIFKVCFDSSSGYLWFGRNADWYDSSGGTTGNPSNNTNPTITISSSEELFPIVIAYANAIIFNFGQDPTFGGPKTPSGGTNSDGSYPDKSTTGIGGFFYEPPAGALALCTANLRDMTPTVNDDVPKDYFKAVIWDGNGTSQNITEVGFQSDLVWWKGRGPTQYYHNVTDSIRGVTKQLFTNAAGAEETNTTRITGWLSNGFSIGNKNDINTSGEKYVAWCWKAGGNSNTFNINGTGYSTYSALQTANTSLPASSTSGMIVPSGMSINTDAGFSIIKWVGNNTDNASIPHGLTKEPDFVIIKNTIDTTVWIVKLNPNTNPAVSNEQQYLYLHLTNNFGTNTGEETQLTTNTIKFVGTSLNSTNGSGDDMVAYCWHSVEGYSKFGSYTGNGSTNGPFVYCGFRPAFVMLKQITTTSDYTSWAIFDNARDPSNPTNYLHSIYANRSAQEGKRGDGTSANSANVVVLDILSNGFKLRDVGGGEVNQDTKEYIFMAFAEQSFNYANAR